MVITRFLGFNAQNIYKYLQKIIATLMIYNYKIRSFKYFLLYESKTDSIL